MKTNGDNGDYWPCLFCVTMQFQAIPVPFFFYSDQTRVKESASRPSLGHSSSIVATPHILFLICGWTETLWKVGKGSSRPY